MKDLIKLKSACDSVISDPKLEPIKDPNTGAILTTYCNFGAMRIAHIMGCNELWGLTADQMYHEMAENESEKWLKVNGTTASIFAQGGQLVFASMTSVMLKETHGHIAACYPTPMQFSVSLGRNVPCVANVGKINMEEKESMAFPVSCGEPDYFAWLG